MGLRCLLGHDFGNREVERERQEDGNEVVVTYRTVETCQRCGDRRVVSENKEVRPIRGGEEIQTGLGGGVDVTADTADEATADEATGEPAADETAADPADAIEVAEADAAEAGDGGPTAAEDDGVILTDDGDDAGRERGQWPDANVNERSESAVEASTAAPPTTDDAVVERGSADGQSAPDDATERGSADGQSAPDDAAERGSVDGQSASDDAVVLGGDDWPDHEGDDGGFDAERGSSGGTDVSFEGLTPESSTAANGEATFVDDADADDAPTDPDKEFVRAADVDVERSAPGTRTEFYCPNCGLSRLAGDSSMRAGDICPDCQKGYIAERDA
ncbi:hypothetical protein ACFQJD_17890 [Haloplanus sp. GCM10025708]|uniref:DUF7093 family protein n=1 Tax=Haloferacaceae TaxID=1644056 RepID=UPI00361A3699